ncbi:hypothetical protein CBM2626_A40102 [Cupriavidus taiwanensis]|uniref:Uncharacterized protein n=1 Tax=Cupriavidus taiwanensis TaxID=164546 RepID=A0A375E762_9BURK|nr:hypothetical protein CBM2613_A50088 [Cupriavidus taiwanensis]SOZ99557.1 hypothetical protein CBM2626_A40102 [Cupriavidus taiwanensis]
MADIFDIFTTYSAGAPQRLRCLAATEDEPEPPTSASPASDDGNGSYRASNNAPALTAARGQGDGTVPAFSGEAPRDAGVVASFRHGSDGGGSENANRKGYDHQGSYNDPRARWATLYGIAKISQLADWHSSEK